MERTATGDNDARVLFCRSTAGFPREHDLAAHDFESIAEFLDNGSDGIDLAVLVDLSGAAALAVLRLRPIAVGNGRKPGNRTNICALDRTGVKAVGDIGAVHILADNTAGVRRAIHAAGIIAVCEHGKLRITGNAANYTTRYIADICTALNCCFLRRAIARITGNAPGICATFRRYCAVEGAVLDRAGPYFADNAANVIIGRGNRSLDLQISNRRTVDRSKQSFIRGRCVLNIQSLNCVLLPVKGSGKSRTWHRNIANDRSLAFCTG